MERRREGRYLLRTNLTGRDPAELWQFYMRLCEIEAAFKNLKVDLELRPVYHWRAERIEAHLFVAFLACGLHVTLRARLRPPASGLTPRVVLDKLAAIEMLEIEFPTSDGRTLIRSRYTQAEPEHQLLLDRLGRTLPPQPPPRLTSAGQLLLTRRQPHEGSGDLAPLLCGFAGVLTKQLLGFRKSGQLRARWPRLLQLPPAVLRAHRPLHQRCPAIRTRR
jgi:hypothetical protein